MTEILVKWVAESVHLILIFHSTLFGGEPVQLGLKTTPQDTLPYHFKTPPWRWDRPIRLDIFYHTL